MNRKYILNVSQINEFIETGVLVVPEVLLPNELESARIGFKESLIVKGVNLC